MILPRPLKVAKALPQRLLHAVKALRPFAYPLLLVALLVSVIPATVAVSSVFRIGIPPESGGSDSEGSSHPAGPVAYYPFDDDTADDAAHGNDGSLVGGASFSTTVPATPENVKSLAVDGVDDHADVASMTSLNIATGSWALWVNFDAKPTDAGHHMNPLAKADQYWVHASDGTGANGPVQDAIQAKIRVGGIRYTTSTAANFIQTGVWYHVAGTYDGETLRLFVDGGLVDANTAPSGDLDTSSVDLAMGTWSTHADFFDGLLDEVQIYDRPLDPDEIAFLAAVQDTLFVDADGDVGFGDSIDCDGVGIGAFTVIQEAVDAASAGDTVRLCGGTYRQSVTIGPEDSELQIRAAEEADPVLDGSGTADAGSTLDSQFAIRLLDGVHDLKIRDLEIRNVPGSRGSAIVAWAVSTAHITVRDNHLHDNAWNGVLVGSEGDFLHLRWKVEGNLVEDNGFVGIELTNCNRCRIRDNAVHDSGFANIVVQARNTVAESGLVTVEQVEVDENELGGALFGIYVLSLTSHPTLFTPLTGASSLLREVGVEENVIEGASVAGIRLWAFNDAATVKDSAIKGNEIVCPPAGAAGIEILERGSGTERGTVGDIEVQDNDIHDRCDPAFVDEGEDTQVDDEEGGEPHDDQDDEEDNDEKSA